MSGIYFYDDAVARSFEPFALTRPLCTLLAGAELIYRRWEMVTGLPAAGFVGAPHLRKFDESGAPAFAAESIPAGSLIVNSRFVPALGAKLDAAAYVAGGRTCAVRITSDLTLDALLTGTFDLDPAGASGAREIGGCWLDNVWELVSSLPAQLNEDIPILSSGVPALDLSTWSVIGDAEVYCEDGVRIDPLVVFDTSAGPILIRRGASIAPFSRIAGPAFIGEGSMVMGESLSGCSIGDHCKVRGEISSSVMLGHSNKGHAGFVGHSYLARWVNLGSGTTTSNLKNTYGTVQLWTPDGVRDTGQQFVGTLFGDHVKTSIGMMLNTGTVLGAGANVFGAMMPPKVVPPFAWGDCAPYETYAKDKFTAVAERVMARRHVELSAKGRAAISDAFDARWSE